MPRSASRRPSSAAVLLIALVVIAAVAVTQSPALRSMLLRRGGAAGASAGAPSAPVAQGFAEPEAAAAPLPPPDSFMATCPMEGSTERANVALLNRLKNRTAAPAPRDVDSAVTLAAMLRPGDDTRRFSERRAATIEGWVVKVKSGGRETVNCGAAEERDRDTHLELAADSADVDPTHHVIVEVTPRMRAVHPDAWSTDSLRHALRGRRVRVTGWLFFDGEHVNAAANTRPGGAHNWRATAWEIHPITRLEVLSDSAARRPAAPPRPRHSQPSAAEPSDTAG